MNQWFIQNLLFRISKVVSSIICSCTYEWNFCTFWCRANLSNDYFTNRQDRYVLIEDCGPLADFYDGLVSRVSEFSLQLGKGDEVQLHSSWKWHPYKGKREEFESAARDRIWNHYRSAMSQQEKFGKSRIIIISISVISTFNISVTDSRGNHWTEEKVE